jgi:hypothetical protein
LKGKEMANLPEQLRKQVEAAQSLVDSHYGVKKPEAADVTDVVPKPAPEAVAPVKAQETTPVNDENSVTYAQRWRSLQGVYNSAQGRVNSLEQQVQQLQQLVSTLQTAPVTGMAQSKFLTDQDTADYGTDLVDMARRAAREELKDFAGAVGSLKQDVDGMRRVVPEVQRLAQENQQTAQEKFFAGLARAVPDYEQVNANPQFHQWLLTADPMTGILRQTYLVDAQRAGDVPRVGTIFNSWKSLSGTQGQTQARTNTKRELELQQAPGRNLSVAPTDKTGRQWDPREITALYDDKRRGKYAGKEAEFKALEQDIFLAQQEGRIVRRAA